MTAMDKHSTNKNLYIYTPLYIKLNRIVHEHQDKSKTQSTEEGTKCREKKIAQICSSLTINAKLFNVIATKFTFVISFSFICFIGRRQMYSINVVSTLEIR